MGAGTSQHRWEVGQGLFAKILGLMKRSIFNSAKNAETLPSPFPHLNVRGFSPSFHSWPKVQPREVKEPSSAPLVSQAQSWKENATLKETKFPQLLLPNTRSRTLESCVPVCSLGPDM